MDLKKLSDLCIIAARDAGNFLKKNKFLDKEIYKEEGRDIKLEIDRSAEKIIRHHLEPTKINILGEEFGGDLNSKTLWVIDPLDGTSNYFRGLDLCCISIGLMSHGKCLIGVIYNFNTEEIYSAIKGGGSFLNNNKISVSSIDQRNKASLTTGFPASETLESSVSFLGDLKSWKKVRMFGSAALSCAYVASGKCDFYAEKGVYLWDFAAGICLVEEAGGIAEYSPIDNQRYEVSFRNRHL